jgi:TonB family protein
MDARRARRLLIIAFAISIFVHLVIAVVARFHNTVEHEQTQVVSFTHRDRILRVVHRQTVVPQTPPPSTPVPLPSSNPGKHRPTTTTSHNGKRPANAGSTPAPVIAKVRPSPTSAGACVKPNAPAGVATEPSPADIPLDVRAQNANGTASILVKLDDKGAVLSASVEQSSGNAGLDQVAMTDARNAEYAPAYKDCKPYASEYTFRRAFTVLTVNNN